MDTDPLVLCDGSCGKCNYSWYVKKTKWDTNLLVYLESDWLGFAEVRGVYITIYSKTIRIEKAFDVTGTINMCERFVLSGEYVKIPNKEFFEVYKKMRGKGT